MASDAIYAAIETLDADDFGSLPVGRVRKAFEQVADQLRELILLGRLKSGARLPTEQELASSFGVSRATIRESLRVLTTEGLVRTARGSRGGSYVSRPSVDDIERFLRNNIRLLSRSQDVSLNEFLEARELFEVPAARLAAERRSEESVKLLLEAIPNELDRESEKLFASNRDFHTTLIDICSNTLLTFATQPISIVLHTHLVRTQLDKSFHVAVAAQHHEITQAIDSGNGDEAARLMHAHLQWLRPFYERSWHDE
jgi:DNA-binding FadR family transcriptional regulator